MFSTHIHFYDFSFLVGSGALTWAQEMGLECVPAENLISGSY